MIGIHGNGLTHELWMSHDSMLIEASPHPTPSLAFVLTIQLFPGGTFMRDYQAPAQVLGHEYHPVVRPPSNSSTSPSSADNKSGNVTLEPEEWNARPGEQRSERVHDSTPVDVRHTPDLLASPTCNLYDPN